MEAKHIITNESPMNIRTDEFVSLIWYKRSYHKLAQALADLTHEHIDSEYGWCRACGEEKAHKLHRTVHQVVKNDASE